MAFFRRLSPILILTAVLIPVGCKNTKIVTYRVPKESPSPAPAVAAAPASARAIHWQTPAGWQEQKADGMREGSFSVPGPDGTKADMSVITFPGDVGGDLANLNRWRSQVQLPPVSPSELPQAFESVKGPAGTFLMTDLVSKAPRTATGHKERILGAILSQSAQTWFFKMTGDDSLVESQKPAFVAFLKSVRFPSNQGGSPAPNEPKKAASTNSLPPDARGVPNSGALAADALPPGHPPINGGASGATMASTQVPVATGETLTWQAPPDWKPKPGSPMRKGSYAINGPDGVGDLSITAFPGDVGGDLANVNRWRGQIGLPPVSSLDGAVQPLDANGLHMLVFDGANGGQAILAAILPQSGQTWFFKLTGPAALVAKTKPAFLNFLRTVKVPSS